MTLSAAFLASPAWSRQPPEAPEPPAAANSPDMVLLNLPDQVPLDVLIATVSDQLGLRIMYDERAGKSPVSIRSPVELPKRSLLGVLESALKLKGLALVDDEQDDWLRIVEAQSLVKVALAPSRAPAELESARSTLAVTQVFTLRHIGPQRIEAVIKPFLTEPGGSSFILPDQRSLVVTDFARNMGRVGELIALADQPGPEVEVRFVPVRHQPAEVVAATLRSIIASRVQAEGRSPAGEAGGAPASGGRLDILPLEQLSQLALIGPPGTIAAAEELLLAVDAPLGLKMRTYRFTTSSPKRIDSLMRQLLGDGAALPRFRSVVDEEEGLLIVTATEDAHAQIQALKDDLDIQVERTRPVTRFYRLRNTSVQEVLGTLTGLGPWMTNGTDKSTGTGTNGQQVVEPPERPVDGAAVTGIPMEGPNRRTTVPPDAQPQAQGPGAPDDLAAPPDYEPPAQRPGRVAFDDADIIADINTNTLIITAEPAIHDTYAELIRHLDQRRPQVLIEVTFVTMDTSEGYSVGVEISRPDFDDDIKTITFSSFGLSEVDADTGSLSLVPGLGFNGAIIQPDIAEVIIRALASNGRTSVTSAPRLLVNDNATGTLNSVADAPTTSINASNTVSTTSFAGFESAGTTIAITPHISEGDHLQLEYSITLSAFTGESSEGIPPPRQRNEMASEVTIPDGHTVIIGGLTRTDLTESIEKIPILGDLPVLEYLFSTRSKGAVTTTLFVFLRPVILRDDQFRDLKLLSEQELAAAGLPSPYPASEPMLVH